MTIRLQPMVHVHEMRSAVAFYRGLGAEVIYGISDGDFTMLEVAGASLALPPNPDQDEGTVELNFEADEPLEALQDRLIGAGATLVQEATSTGFGEQLILRSPDGLPVKINRIDRDQVAGDT